MKQKKIEDIIGYLNMANSCIKRCQELLNEENESYDITSSDTD